jgi:hypothetical protein
MGIKKGFVVLLLVLLLVPFVSAGTCSGNGMVLSYTCPTESFVEGTNEIIGFSDGGGSSEITDVEYSTQFDNHQWLGSIGSLTLSSYSAGTYEFYFNGKNSSGDTLHSFYGLDYYTNSCFCSVTITSAITEDPTITSVDFTDVDDHPNYAKGYNIPITVKAHFPESVDGNDEINAEYRIGRLRVGSNNLVCEDNCDVYPDAINGGDICECSLSPSFSSVGTYSIRIKADAGGDSDSEHVDNVVTIYETGYCDNDGDERYNATLIRKYAPAGFTSGYYSLDDGTLVAVCLNFDDNPSQKDDCNDKKGTIHPGATEICDGIRNDCTTALPDSECDDDRDGYVELGLRCFEADVICYNENDKVVPCNGDACQDGYGVDCDDTKGLYNPGVYDYCGIETDDCDFDIDEDWKLINEEDEYSRYNKLLSLPDGPYLDEGVCANALQICYDGEWINDFNILETESIRYFEERSELMVVNSSVTER